MPFIVFASLSIVYLFKTRAQLRVLITGLWIFLGTVNGIILSNRVTPFSYTDFKMLPDLFAMQNTNYFTAEEATVVVAVVASFIIFLVLFFIKGPVSGKTPRCTFPTCDRCTVSCRYSNYNTGTYSRVLILLPLTLQILHRDTLITDLFMVSLQALSDVE